MHQCMRNADDASDTKRKRARIVPIARSGVGLSSPQESRKQQLAGRPGPGKHTKQAKEQPMLSDQAFSLLPHISSLSSFNPQEISSGP